MSWYPHRKAGEWLRPGKKGFRMMCCDCALIHVLKFRVRKGRAEFSVRVDKIATRETRKKRNITIEKVPL